MPNKITIVLTVYNGEAYLKEQLDSIYNQSFKDWDLVICEDKSTDNTRAVLKDYFRNVKNVKIIYNKTNMKLAKNFEQGLHYVTGDYVAVCDVDDVWDKEKLELQVKYLDNHPQIGMVYHDLKVVDDKLILKSQSYRRILRGKPWSLHRFDVNNDSLKTLLRENHITAPSIVFRASLIKSLVPFQKSLTQDYWIALVAAKVSKIGYLDKTLVSYRQHSNNMVGASVRSYSYYFNKMITGEILKEYLISSLDYIKVLQSLKAIPGTYPKQNKWITNKINGQQALANYINRSNGLIVTIKAILINSNYYQLNILAYLLMCKILSKVPFKPISNV